MTMACSGGGIRPDSAYRNSLGRDEVVVKLESRYGHMGTRLQASTAGL